jgi:signal peptidase II
MKMKKEYVLHALIIILILFLDQITKYFISSSLSLGGGVEVFKNFFYITYIHNDGAAFGIMSGSKIPLIFFSLIVIGFISYQYKSYKDSKFIKISFSVLLGGLLGNLIDRIIHGYVIDFIEFKIFGYNLPIFNISDIAIVVSVFLIIIGFSLYEGGEINENIDRGSKQRKTRLISNKKTRNKQK